MAQSRQEREPIWLMNVWGELGHKIAKLKRQNFMKWAIASQVKKKLTVSLSNQGTVYRLEEPTG